MKKNNISTKSAEVEKDDDYISISPEALNKLKAKVNKDMKDFHNELVRIDYETQVYGRILGLIKNYKKDRKAFSLLKINADGVKKAKTTIEKIIFFNTELAIEMILDYYHGDMAKDRKRLEAIQSVQKAKAGKKLTPEEKLLAEIFGGKEIKIPDACNKCNAKTFKRCEKCAHRED